jgi:hypothetical protein
VAAPARAASSESSVASEPQTETRAQPEAQNPTAEPQPSSTVAHHAEVDGPPDATTSATGSQVEPPTTDDGMTTTTVVNVPTTDDGGASDD